MKTNLKELQKIFNADLPAIRFGIAVAFWKKDFKKELEQRKQDWEKALPITSIKALIEIDEVLGTTK